MGHRRRQPRPPGGVESETCRGLRGTARAWRSFLSRRQDVSARYKTHNPLFGRLAFGGRCVPTDRLHAPLRIAAACGGLSGRPPVSHPKTSCLLTNAPLFSVMSFLTLCMPELRQSGKVSLTGVLWAPAQQDGAPYMRYERTLEAVGWTPFRCAPETDPVRASSHSMVFGHGTGFRGPAHVRSGSRDANPTRNTPQRR
jgi:hypothetical protein